MNCIGQHILYDLVNHDRKIRSMNASITAMAVTILVMGYAISKLQTEVRDIRREMKKDRA